MVEVQSCVESFAFSFGENISVIFVDVLPNFCNGTVGVKFIFNNSNFPLFRLFRSDTNVITAFGALNVYIYILMTFVQINGLH
jgi:hypothetical protein